MTDQHNGMTGAEQPEIRLYEHHLLVKIVTSAPIDLTHKPSRELIANAINSVLPPAEDGDVFVTLQAKAAPGAVSIADVLAVVERCTPKPAGGAFSHTNSMRCIADDICKGIEALAGQHGAREGYVLVPKEPTKTMLDAGITAAEEVEDWSRDTSGSYRCDTPSDAVLPTYRAMIAAAPATDVG